MPWFLELKTQPQTKMLTEGTLPKLRNFSLDCSTVLDDIVASSLTKMRFLELSSTNMTSRQLSALFKLLKKDSTVLEEITLIRNMMSHVPAQDLAKS